MKSVLIRCHPGLGRAITEPASRRITRRAIQLGETSEMGETSEASPFALN